MNAVTEVMAELRKALVELEDCRARSADLRTMLERVTRERAACPDCAMWAERSARWHDDMQRAERERDEARAEVERMRAEADRWKRSCNVFRERDWSKAFQATVTSLEQEVSDAHEQLATLHKLSKPWEGNAYRRGAEAMREACAQWVDHWVSGHVADKLRDMPIPEEP